MLYVTELSTGKECEYNPTTNKVKIYSKNLMMPSGYEVREFYYMENKEFFSKPYTKTV